MAQFLKRYLQNWKFYAKNSKSYIYHILGDFFRKTVKYGLHVSVSFGNLTLIPKMVSDSIPLDNPFLEQIFRNSLKFPNFNTNFGLEREPFVPHKIWSHFWNQRQILHRMTYMKTIFNCFSEKNPKNVIYVRFWIFGIKFSILKISF